MSFYIFPDFHLDKFAAASTTVSLQPNTTGDIFASTVIPAQNWNIANWTYIKAQIIDIVPAPNVNNTLVLTFDATVASGQTYFNQVSLSGEALKGYENGPRKDLAQNMYDLKPRFLRWPGRNNMQGFSHQKRWEWFGTIGPLKERWGRPGTWCMISIPLAP